MKRMKFTLRSVAIALITVLMLNGCQLRTQKKEVKERESIKIGAVLPMTGDLAFLGEPIKHATDVAVEGINAKGGVRGKMIDVIYEDSQASPTTGVTAVNKLINVDNVGIITTFLTGVSEASKPITEKNNVLLLAQTVSPEIYKDTKLTIRFHYSFVKEGELLRDYIVGKMPEKVFLINSSDPSTSYEFENIVVPGLKNNSISYLQEKFNLGTRDFATVAAKVKQAKCDLIVIGGYGSDIPFLLKDLSDQGITPESHIICGNIGFIEIPRSADINLYENTVFASPPFMINRDAEALDFEEKYKAVSGDENVGYSAYYAYDMMVILKDVIEKVGFNDPFKIKAGFVGEYEGLGGKYIIDASGDVNTEIVMGTIEDGEFRLAIED